MTVIVVNSLGVPPANLTPFLADCACLESVILQGAASFQVVATPIKGFASPVTVTNAGNLEEHSTDGGVFFDRLRLFRLLNDLPDDLKNECIEWCELRINQMIA